MKSASDGCRLWLAALLNAAIRCYQDYMPKLARMPISSILWYGTVQNLLMLQFDCFPALL